MASGGFGCSGLYSSFSFFFLFVLGTGGRYIPFFSLSFSFGQNDHSISVYVHRCVYDNRLPTVFPSSLPSRSWFSLMLPNPLHSSQFASAGM